MTTTAREKLQTSLCCGRDGRLLDVVLAHCKFAGADNAGARVGDLYEVCGQAMKSHKARGEVDLVIRKLLRRGKQSIAAWEHWIHQGRRTGADVNRRGSKIPRPTSNGCHCSTGAFCRPIQCPAIRAAWLYTAVSEARLTTAASGYSVASDEGGAKKAAYR